MKILAISDIHKGHKVLKEIIDEEEYDLLLLLGDCIDEYGLPKLNEPTYSIKGNHDDIKYLSDIKPNFTLMETGKRYEFRDIELGGINGIFSSNNFDDSKRTSTKEGCFTKEDIEKCINNLGGIDVFMTHEAPKGLADYSERHKKRLGVDVIRELVEEIEPEIVLSGHIHDRGIEGYSVNCGYGRIGEYVTFGFDGSVKNLSFKELDGGD